LSRASLFRQYKKKDPEAPLQGRIDRLEPFQVRMDLGLMSAETCAFNVEDIAAAGIRTGADAASFSAESIASARQNVEKQAFHHLHLEPPTEFVFETNPLRQVV
jgi:hypothetical protein